MNGVNPKEYIYLKTKILDIFVLEGLDPILEYVLDSCYNDEDKYGN